MSNISNADPRPARPPMALAGHWQLTAGNRAACTVSNFGFRTVRASIPIVEAVVHAGTGGELLSVHAVLQLSDIDTGNRRRDKDLAKPGLLDTARFPTMIFSAGGAAGVTRTGSRELSGTLQARGRTIAVDLRYSTHESAPGRVTVHVVSALDRRELGIKAPALMIGNRVAIDFTAEFERLV